MLKFPKYNVHVLLGVTPVMKVTDRQIWTHLVTPQVQALLGPITAIRPPVVRETLTGTPPGAPGSNINNHLLYGGQSGFVRFPYLEILYITTYGALLIKRDLMKVEVTGWIGDIEKNRSELIFEVALRDRCFDGTSRANDSALIAWPFSDPKLHQRLSDQLSSVEASIYGFVPGSRIGDVTGNPDLEEFVRQPYQFLDRPELFLKYFQQIWPSRRGPGQVGAPIPDVSRVIDTGITEIARLSGYDLVEATTSHYNVAHFVMSRGYRFNYIEQARDFAQLDTAVRELTKTLRLSRTQQSWCPVIQGLKPPESIPSELNLGGPSWPWDNICPDYLWLNKPISDKARGLLPGPIPR